MDKENIIELWNNIFIKQRGDRRKEMCHQQISEQIMVSNKNLLENTFAFVQTEKLFTHLSEKTPLLKAKKRNTNKYGKIYNRFYEDYEVSTEHITALYKIANQD
ncbi:MAG: hypothetical protein ABFD25_16070 [Clostridiaceae bacterium]